MEFRNNLTTLHINALALTKKKSKYASVVNIEYRLFFCYFLYNTKILPDRSIMTHRAFTGISSFYQRPSNGVPRSFIDLSILYSNNFIRIVFIIIVFTIQYNTILLY